MELNAKITSLEDEVKLLKGEVKLILSEIRTAILGQDNPFTEPGQGLRPERNDSRPPIRVVRVSNDEATAAAPPVEEPEALSPPTAEDIWQDEPEAPSLPPSQPPPPPSEPRVMEKPPESQPAQEPSPAPTPLVSYPPPPPFVPPPDPVRPILVQAAGRPHWSLITIAGLAVWVEEAVKQLGIKRLRILLDLCEFSGALSSESKEGLLKVTGLVHASLERKTPPSTNDCLVVLCQLDALLKGEQTAGLSFSELVDKRQKTA